MRCQRSTASGNRSFIPRTAWITLLNGNSSARLLDGDRRRHGTAPERRAGGALELVHDLLIGDLAARLAVNIEQARVAAGDADRGGARLAGAVDATADDGHVQRLADVVESRLEGVDRGDDVEFLARAGGTGDDVHALGTQPQALEDVEADPHLLHRIGGERDADGVADAIGEQHAYADGGFDRAGTQAAGLGDAEMQRLFDL